jgi:sorting nexin-8
LIPIDEKKDVSVEQVALLAQQNTLPEPTLDISLLSYSAAATTSNTTTITASRPSLSYGQPPASTSTSSGGGSNGHSGTVPPPPADDPWMTGRFGTYPSGGGAGINGGGGAGGMPSSVSGTGLPSGWWKRQEKVLVQFGGQQGFVLNRYMVYGITTEVRKREKTYT